MDDCVTFCKKQGRSYLSDPLLRYDYLHRHRQPLLEVLGCLDGVHIYRQGSEPRWSEYYYLRRYSNDSIQRTQEKGRHVKGPGTGRVQEGEKDR